MSAFPPKADMCGAKRDVRFVPIADIPPPATLYRLPNADSVYGGELSRDHHDARTFTFKEIILAVAGN
jgi:hypothetical protein